MLRLPAGHRPRPGVAWDGHEVRVDAPERRAAVRRAPPLQDRAWTRGAAAAGGVSRGGVPMTDADRIVRFLREHPGSSVMDIRFALFISNVTARMSDARADGVTFVKWRDDRGVYRYRVVDPEPVQLAMAGFE